MFFSSWFLRHIFCAWHSSCCSLSGAIHIGIITMRHKLFFICRTIVMMIGAVAAHGHIYSSSNVVTIIIVVSYRTHLLPVDKAVRRIINH